MPIEPVEEKDGPFRAIEACPDNAFKTAEHNVMDFGCVLGNLISRFKGRNNVVPQ